MDLSSLKPAKGARRRRKRIGRGQGSGRGGTATRGHKGQKSRRGAPIPAWFEGGQMPLQRRVPKFGFKNPFRVSYQPLNLWRVSQLLEEGILRADEPITPELLYELGIFRRKQPIKLLGDGEITTAVQITVHACSASAREKVEAVGGSVTLVKPSR